MARNGGHATKTTGDQPKEFYDELSQEDQDFHDEIGKLGYRITQNYDSGMFEAAKGQTRIMGDTLAELLIEVRDVEQVTPAEAEISNDVDADHPDGHLFQEMKPKRQVVIPELRQPILNYEAYKEERIQVLAKEVEAKKIVNQLMHDHKEHLAFDPETGVHSYRLAIDGGNDIIMWLEPGEDKLKSRRATDDDEE